MAEQNETLEGGTTVEAVRENALQNARAGRDRNAPAPFGKPSFVAGSGRIYDAGRTGGKGCTAIVATVPLFGMVNIAVNIGATYDPRRGELKVEASKPRGLAFNSEADADRFLAHIENAAAKWNGYDDAISAAERRIAAEYGQKLAPANGEKAIDRPRLVRSMAIKTDSKPSQS